MRWIADSIEGLRPGAARRRLRGRGRLHAAPLATGRAPGLAGPRPGGGRRRDRPGPPPAGPAHLTVPARDHGRCPGDPAPGAQLLRRRGGGRRLRSGGGALAPGHGRVDEGRPAGAATRRPLRAERDRSGPAVRCSAPRRPRCCASSADVRAVALAGARRARTWCCWLPSGRCRAPSDRRPVGPGPSTAARFAGSPKTPSRCATTTRPRTSCSARWLASDGHARVHLHHAAPHACAPARQGGALRRHARLLPRGEDRRAGRQRRRQVDASADHGRGRHRVSRQGRPRGRGHRGAARAGAPARREQGRPGQRRGRRPPAAGHARPVQRAGGQLLRGHRGRVRGPPGEDRRRRRLEPRHAAGHRDGCPALPAGRLGRGPPQRGRAPPRGPLPAPALPARPAAAGRAHQPPGRGLGRLAGAPPARLPGRRGGRDPRPLLPRQRGRLDPGARPRPGASRSRATIRPGWSRSRPAWPRRRSRSPPASARWPGSWSGCG